MSKKFARMNVIEFVSEDAFDIINERYSSMNAIRKFGATPTAASNSQ